VPLAAVAISVQLREKYLMKDQFVSAFQNHLLDSMQPDVKERLGPHLEYIEAPLDMKLYEPYERMTYAYFPANCLGSIVATTSTGHSTEIGVVGSEGMVGLELLMGVDASPHKSMVQIAGHAYRIKAEAVQEEFRRCGSFHDLVLHFAQKLSVQVAQTTLCNRLHTVDERLPRWLLMCHDRIDGDVLLLTQEFIALMLGTSRVTVTQAAQIIQNIGYIKYVRGKITILDRHGLEDVSCDCYSVVKREYDRKLN
jgi:CRP-like cAMP-binding protein